MAASRKRRVFITLAVVVVVLVGLFVAADRVAAHLAEGALVKQAKQELADQDITSPRDPTASIGGFPFLTQVARGRYDKITIEVARPTGFGFTVDDLVVVATGVRADTGDLLNGSGDVTADKVTGTVHVGWAAVNKLIDLSEYGGGPVSVSALPDGKVRIQARITVLGASANVIATGSLRIVGADPQVVEVDVERVDFADGQVPAVLRQLAGSLQRALTFTMRIPRLPYGLKVTGVKALPEGVTLTASATNVPISRAG